MDRFDKIQNLFILSCVYVSLAKGAVNVEKCYKTYFTVLKYFKMTHSYPRVLHTVPIYNLQDLNMSEISM